MGEGFAVDTDELRAAAGRLQTAADALAAVHAPALPDVAASGLQLARTLDELGRGAACLVDALHDIAENLRKSATSYDDCDAAAGDALRRVLRDRP